MGTLIPFAMESRPGLPLATRRWGYGSVQVMYTAFAVNLGYTTCPQTRVTSTSTSTIDQSLCPGQAGFILTSSLMLLCYHNLISVLHDIYGYVSWVPPGLLASYGFSVRGNHTPDRRHPFLRFLLSLLSWIHCALSVALIHSNVQLDGEAMS